jgi:hypothetical protein
VSCKRTSILELESKIPVKPPAVNKKTKPLAHRRAIEEVWECLLP